MSIHTVENLPTARKSFRKRGPLWRNILVFCMSVGLLIVAILMRVYDLGLPIERDYDEGVYWQSLRAMHTGHALYQQIFYSQPPAFLLSIYPTFAAFGSSLWSARFGIALVSLLGLVGAFLLGKALRGQVGAIAALALLVADPIYLVQSQVIQAEIPSVAFSLLAIGLGYLWWENPEGWAGISLAVLVGVTAALSILGKLLMVSLLVPLGLLMLARLVVILRGPRTDLWHRLWPLVSGMVAALVTCLLFLLPFLAGASTQFFQQVVSFHTAASQTFAYGQVHNWNWIQAYLKMFLTLAAGYGTVVSLLRRDWRVVPLLAWLLTTGVLLDRQVPLFQHHFIAFTPPLIGLAICGTGSFPFPGDRRRMVELLVSLGAVLLIALSLVVSIRQDRGYYRSDEQIARGNSASYMRLLASDLQKSTTPGELVITDSQYVAGLADRDTPPELVDTSTVRGVTKYLTGQQLIGVGKSENVHAVLLFSTGRLRNVSGFGVFFGWVKANFHLEHAYPGDSQLWVR